MSINQQWEETPTRLFLNGPKLSFTSEPSSITLDSGASGTFVGVATATFPAEVTDAESDGAIAYQWYRKLASESSFSALGAGSTFYSGQNSTTLSIDFALSPDFHSSEYYLEATYNPVGLGVTEGTAGDAFNEPIITSTATLSTNPGLAINVQPSDQTAVVNSNATFTVTPTLTDVTQGAVTYQWSVNGSPASDGDTTTTSTLTTSSNKYVYSNTTDGRLILDIPDDATDVQIEISGGKGGNGENYLNGTGGGGGYGARGTFNLPDGGRQLELYIGTVGGNVIFGGGQGGGTTVGAAYDFIKGGDGGSGNSQAGGGGSGSFVKDATAGEYIIAAGGGGGGGGGAQNSGTSDSGSNAGDFSALGDLDIPSNTSTSSTGENGQDIATGGGGGGGGSGYRGGSGGEFGANIAPPPPEPPPPPPEPPAPPPPQPPPPPSGGGKIICKTLAALGYFKDEEMNNADQRFAIWLKRNDPVAYDGYIVWAQTVVDLMNGEGPESARKIAFFWEKDDSKRILIQQKITCYYMDALARPWAEEMAHRMGAKGYEKSNPAGKLVMGIGLPLCRLVGRAKSNKKMNPTLKVFLIWKIVTILLVSCGTISAIDLLLNKIKRLFK